MPVHRIPSSELQVFETLPPELVPPFVDLECRDDPGKILEGLPESGLAIVGSRSPQKRSLELMERTLGGLRGSGLLILSGFARGIDSRAHELALENGLGTLAILGCGIDVDYPRENRQLKDRILAAGGMILSCFERGTPPLPRNFYERNGLIAGFANAVWVVQAAGVSGTLNTANWAMKLNRNLYATSCFPGDPFYEGNEKLLSQKSTERYPVAESFFGPHSLESTWTDRLPGQSAQSELPWREKPRSEIQTWVLEIKHASGECHLHALLNHALQKGHTPVSFYRNLEAELAAGALRQSLEGCLEINPR